MAILLIMDINEGGEKILPDKNGNDFIACFQLVDSFGKFARVELLRAGQ